MSESALDIFEIERFAIHDGKGIRTNVFFQGCPLRCQWCANPESQTVGRHIMHFKKRCTGCGKCENICRNSAIKISDGKSEIDRQKCVSCGKCAEMCPGNAIKISGRKITCDKLFDIVARDLDYYETSGGGVTISGGEALLQLEKMQPFLEKCRSNHIDIAAETCGCVSKEKIVLAEKFVDSFLFDIKSIDAEKFRKYTGGDLSVVKAAFETLCRIAPEKVIARVPVIPGFNDGDISEIMKYVHENSVRGIHFLPYHTLGISKYEQLNREYEFPCRKSLSADTLEHLVKDGEEMGLTVRIGG